MTWWDFVVESAGTDNQSEIGRRLHITQPSVSQWKTSAPKKETVRRFAEEFDVPVVRAFIAAGYFTEAEAREFLDD
jgi:transcriptional regulator with XRE-family HTH domain